MSRTLKSRRLALRWGVLMGSSAIALAALLSTFGRPVLATAGVISEFPIPSSSSGPYQVVAGADGALWFTESGLNQIGRVTTSGSFSEFPVPTATPAGSPQGIAAGPDGALWFTEPNVGQIGRITTSGFFSEFPLAPGIHPQFIAAGSDGALWFTEPGAVLTDSQIGRISLAGEVTQFSVSGTNPSGITLGPDGAVWFTDRQGGIGRVSTAGIFTEYPMSSPNNAPYSGITSGPDGAIWFTEQTWPTGNAIGRMALNGSVTDVPVTAIDNIPLFVTAGPDNAVWFTERKGGTIGRIATDGTGSLTEYPLPCAGCVHGPHGIALGPDGALWFAELDANQIARITPVSAPPSDPFVRRSGTQLLLAGQPFTFHGVNIYNANSDGWCGYQYTNAELGAALDRVGPNGVVRAWFFQSQAASKSPGSAHLWSGLRDWTRFDTLLLLAQQKGLRVIVTLTDQWGECGDGPTAGYKTDTWYGGPSVGGVRDGSQAGYKVADPLETALPAPAHGYDNWVSYRAWVQEVVGRYCSPSPTCAATADHPEILAWQLINEGEAKTASNGSCPTDATAAMTAWADDVSNLIHTLDPNHLISLGTLGTGQCGTAGAGYSALHGLPNIDLCELHDYGPETLPAALQTHINECNSLHKPIFVG